MKTLKTLSLILATSLMTVGVIGCKGKKEAVPSKGEVLVDVYCSGPEYFTDKKFFRANRSFIINFDHISDVVVYSTSRLRVKYPHEFVKAIIVSREKVSDFKACYA